jgi:hypothetical protein
MSELEVRLSPLHLDDATGTDFVFVEASPENLVILNSRTSGADSEANPQLVAKALTSVGALFANWEKLWPKSFRVWNTPGLRLLVAKDLDVDYLTGDEVYTQSWVVVTASDRLLAFLTPMSGIRDPDTVPSEKLCGASIELTPFLAEPYRYFAALSIPSSAGTSTSRSWRAGPCLDLPGMHPLLEDAVRDFAQQDDLDLDPVFDHLDADRLRCYLVTSAGDFIVYKEDVPHSDLHRVNIDDLSKIHRVVEPGRVLDDYVSRSLAYVVSL